MFISFIRVYFPYELLYLIHHFQRLLAQIVYKVRFSSLSSVGIQLPAVLMLDLAVKSLKSHILSQRHKRWSLSTTVDFDQAPSITSCKGNRRMSIHIEYLYSSFHLAYKYKGGFSLYLYFINCILIFVLTIVIYILVCYFISK